MKTIIQIVRKRIWWILLALVIVAVIFFRPSILGFKEGMKTPAPKTLAGKTPAPKTPAPKTPAPKTPAGKKTAGNNVAGAGAETSVTNKTMPSELNNNVKSRDITNNSAIQPDTKGVPKSK
jgi:hypothetical protein